MEASPNLVQMAWGAFLLRPETYAGMRDDARRIQRALVLVVVVGLLAGAAAGLGRLAEWAFSPNLDKIQAIVLQELEKTSWFAELEGSREAMDTFNRQYDLGWGMAKAMVPSPAALSNIITLPISFLLSWLVYGVLAHLAARLLGGRGRLGQTLACTALAVTPQLLTVFTVLPFVTAAGVSTWTLACNFAAIRAAHELSGWRALAATLLPLVLGLAVVVLFACGGAALLVPVLSRMGGAR